MFRTKSRMPEEAVAGDAATSSMMWEVGTKTAVALFLALYQVPLSNRPATLNLTGEGLRRFEVSSHRWPPPPILQLLPANTNGWQLTVSGGGTARLVFLGWPFQNRSPFSLNRTKHTPLFIPRAKVP